MYIVHVFARIKPDRIEDFKTASIENARSSIKEPGIARFDVIQQKDDPTRFVLVEVYRTADDPSRHKETTHYHKWRGAVEPMMAEPRTNTQFLNIFPGGSGWDTEPIKDEI
jgi:quinol monooxygenase YgiN